MSASEPSPLVANLDVEPLGVREGGSRDQTHPQPTDQIDVEAAATTTATTSAVANTPGAGPTLPVPTLPAPATAVRTVRPHFTLPTPVSVERPAPVRALPPVPVVAPPVVFPVAPQSVPEPPDAQDLDDSADGDGPYVLNLGPIPLDSDPRPLMIEPSAPEPRIDDRPADEPRPQQGSDAAASVVRTTIAERAQKAEQPRGGTPVPAALAVPGPQTSEVVTRAVGELLSRAAGTAPTTTWTAKPSRYLTDPDAAARHVALVAEQVAAGRPPVPYFMQDATDGLAVEGRGDLTFGVRIPFVLPAGLPAEERAAVRQAIVADLWHQGLIRRAGPGRDDAGPDRDDADVEVRTEARDSWSLEPGPPDEALVSPMLRDTPRTWVILRTVLETVVRYRGTTRPGLAADIHVGPGGHARLTLRQHMAVAGIVRGYEDVLYRLGTNPRDVRRRGLAPTGSRALTVRPTPAHGFAEMPMAGHGPADAKIRALSFVAAGRSEHNRFVFGFFDGSLEPGVLQAHVKLALGLTAAAQRLADAPGLEPRFGRAHHDARLDTVQSVRIADGRLVPGAPTVYELDQRSDTSRVVDLLGMVLRRDADIEQQLSVAALTPWPGARAALSDEGAARVAGLFVPAAASPHRFDDGFAFLPDEIPRAHYEKHRDSRRAAEQFTPRPFRVMAGVVDDGAVAVFDGLEVTPAQFATLLRRTAWRPESGILLNFVRLAQPGRTTRRQPLPPPLPGDWSRVLEWTRRTAAELRTCVSVCVAANTRLEQVPNEVLADYRAFGPPEAARLLRDWRAETPTSGMVLRHVPDGTLLSAAAAMPGHGLMPLPDGASSATATLVRHLRQALAGLPAIGPGRQAIGPSPAAASPVEPRYAAHPDLFDEEADRVVRRLVRGEPPLSYEIGDTPAPAQAQPFSLALEFTTEATVTATAEERAAALAAIRAELALITPVPWTLGSSPAPGGVATLVSPVLADDAAAWRGLALAVEAVRRQGGTAAPGTTGRVLIDLAGFAGRIGYYEALLTLIATHRETLHRLGTDPTAVARRTPWSPPAIHDRGAVEFPAWDGSLDEAVLQARTRIWLGVVAAAQRPVRAPEPGRRLPAERTGAHAGTRQRLRHPRDRPLISGRVGVFEPGPAEQTAAARELIDTALTRRADREQAAALFHITPRPGARTSRVQVVHGAGWAVFGHPARAVPARRVAAHAAALGEPTFVAGLGLDSRRAVPVVHGGMGTVAVSPERFARLLAEAGKPPDTAVALWFGDQSRRDLAALTAWTRALAEALAAPVYLDVGGPEAAQLPRAVVEGFELFAKTGTAGPALDWLLAPPRQVWLRYAPGGDDGDAGGRCVLTPTLVPLPDHRLRAFIRDASWHGVDSGVVFARPEETVRLARQLEALDRHELLSTALFARSRDGIPQVSQDGAERGITPAELAAVLFRHAGATPGVELRLAVLDPIDPDDEALRRWAGRVANAAGRTVHYAGPRTSILITEARHLRRSGGTPHDYRLISEQETGGAGPRWRAAAPGGAAAPSRFTDDRGWLRPAGDVPQEERRWPVRRSGPAVLAG